MSATDAERIKKQATARAYARLLLLAVSYGLAWAALGSLRSAGWLVAAMAVFAMANKEVE